MRSPSAIVLGTVTKAVGLKGEVKLRPADDFWPQALACRELRLADRAVAIVASRPHGDGSWVMRFEGAVDRRSAEALVGSSLVLPEGAEVAPPEDLRPFQVRGLRARGPGGRELGIVVDLVSMPAHAVLVVRSGDGEHLIPAVEPILRGIDLESGTVDVDPPAGLLEL